MRFTPISCFAVAMLCGTAAFAANTFKDWNGTSNFQDMGCQGSPTYGQVVTVPKGKPDLESFTFSLASRPAIPPSSSMVVRAEVYAWDGNEATGNNLYESDPLSISYNDYDFGYVFHKITFKPAELHLSPGGVYVLFVTVSKDQSLCYTYESAWGGITDRDKYKSGQFVFTNDPFVADWTTVAWSKQRQVDLAFKAVFGR